MSYTEFPRHNRAKAGLVRQKHRVALKEGPELIPWAAIESLITGSLELLVVHAWRVKMKWRTLRMDLTLNWSFNVSIFSTRTMEGQLQPREFVGRFHLSSPCASLSDLSFNFVDLFKLFSLDKLCLRGDENTTHIPNTPRKVGGS